MSDEWVARVGSHNDHTVYISDTGGRHLPDRFVGIALSRPAAQAVVKALNFSLLTDDNDWIFTLPMIEPRKDHDRP